MTIAPSIHVIPLSTSNIDIAKNVNNLSIEEEFNGIISIDNRTPLNEIWQDAKVSLEANLLRCNGNERSSRGRLRWERKFNTIRSPAIIGKTYAI